MADEPTRQSPSHRIQDDTAENPQASRFLRTSILLFLLFVALVAVLVLILRLRSARDEAPTRSTSSAVIELREPTFSAHLDPAFSFFRPSNPA